MRRQTLYHIFIHTYPSHTCLPSWEFLCDQVQQYTGRRYKLFSKLPSTPSTGLCFPCTPPASAPSFREELEQGTYSFWISVA